MKVMYLIKELSLGGGPRAMYYLCQAMPQVSFFVFAKAGPLQKDFLQLPNVEVKLVSRWNWRSVWQVYQFYLREQIDLLHCHSIIPAVYFIPFGKLQKVITFHGLHIRQYDFRKNDVLRFVRCFIKNMLVRFYQKSIVLCEEDKQYLERLLYQKKNLAIVPNAICIPGTDRKPAGFSPQYLNLLMVARYDFPKGHDIILRMLMEIGRDIPEVRVYFIGNQKVCQLLQAQKDMYDKHIFYLGETTQPYSCIEAADYLLLPSRWEGLPMVVLEALSLGTKVIAADTANVNSLADGRNIYLYRQADAQDFLRVLQVCRQHKADAVDFDLSPYTLQSVGEKMFALYETVCRY